MRSVLGRAALTFAPRDGRTRMVRSETRPPLTVQRALYLDETLPDMAFAFLANPTAGVFAGDMQEVVLRACAGARAHVTTQAATKVHPGRGGGAHLTTHIAVEDGAYLEYLPEPLVPFAHARVRQTTTITVARGSVLVYSDILSPGRVAMGESLEYERLESTLTVCGSDGAPLYHDAFLFSPRRTTGSGPASTPRFGALGIFGRLASPVLGSLLVVCPSADGAALRDGLWEELAGRRCFAAGATALPFASGVAVRALDNDTGVVRSVLTSAWRAARQFLLGADLPPFRKR